MTYLKGKQFESKFVSRVQGIWCKEIIMQGVVVLYERHYGVESVKAHKIEETVKWTLGNER